MLEVFKTDLSADTREWSLLARARTCWSQIDQGSESSGEIQPEIMLQAVREDKIGGKLILGELIDGPISALKFSEWIQSFDIDEGDRRISWLEQRLFSKKSKFSIASPQRKYQQKLTLTDKDRIKMLFGEVAEGKQKTTLKKIKKRLGIREDNHIVFSGLSHSDSDDISLTDWNRWFKNLLVDQTVDVHSKLHWLQIVLFDSETNSSNLKKKKKNEEINHLVDDHVEEKKIDENKKNRCFKLISCTDVGIESTTSLKLIEKVLSIDEQTSHILFKGLFSEIDLLCSPNNNNSSSQTSINNVEWNKWLDSLPSSHQLQIITYIEERCSSSCLQQHHSTTNNSTKLFNSISQLVGKNTLNTRDLMMLTSESEFSISSVIFNELFKSTHTSPYPEIDIRQWTFWYHEYGTTQLTNSLDRYINEVVNSPMKLYSAMVDLIGKNGSQDLTFDDISEIVNENPYTVQMVLIPGLKSSSLGGTISQQYWVEWFLIGDNKKLLETVRYFQNSISTYRKSMSSTSSISTTEHHQRERLVSHEHTSVKLILSRMNSLSHFTIPLVDSNSKYEIIVCATPGRNVSSILNHITKNDVAVNSCDNNIIKSCDRLGLETNLPRVFVAAVSVSNDFERLKEEVKEIPSKYGFTSTTEANIYSNKSMGGLLSCMVFSSDISPNTVEFVTSSTRTSPRPYEVIFNSAQVQSCSVLTLALDGSKSDEIEECLRLVSHHGYGLDQVNLIIKKTGMLSVKHLIRNGFLSQGFCCSVVVVDATENDISVEELVSSNGGIRSGFVSETNTLTSLPSVEVILSEGSFNDIDIHAKDFKICLRDNHPLGIHFNTFNKNKSPTHVAITSIAKGSEAEKAGIPLGKIVSASGQSITTQAELIKLTMQLRRFGAPHLSLSIIPTPTKNTTPQKAVVKVNQSKVERSPVTPVRRASSSRRGYSPSPRRMPSVSGFGFGTSTPRNSNKNQTPGPACYSPRHDTIALAVRETSTKGSLFSTCMRNNLPRVLPVEHSGPGPGDYHRPSASPILGFVGKNNQIRISPVEHPGPGPCDYSPRRWLE